LYRDADSVLFVQRNDEPSLIACADNLGAVVSKLEACEYIQEFVSGGPKNYAYKIVNKTKGKCKTVGKFRGITLNYGAKHLVNFDVIINMILNPKFAADTATVHGEENQMQKK
jgi:hypothetical protein